MKRTKMLILIIAGLAALAGCDSVTGDIIDDYNRAKHPVAAFSSVPGTLVTLDRLEGWGGRIDLYVNSKRITEYRYCINAEKWSGKYDVDDPITLSEPECGLYTVRIVGSINGRHWQSKEHPTEYTFRIVPGRAALKGLTLKDAATQTPLALTPQFEPHIGEYTLQAGPELRRVVAGYSEYYPGECSVTCTTAEGAGQAAAVTGGWEIGLADGENIITVASEITGVSDMSYTITINRTARTWSEPGAISSGGTIGLTSRPHSYLNLAPDNSVYMVWGNRTDDGNSLCVNKYTDNGWQGEEILLEDTENRFLHPNVQFDMNGTIYYHWRLYMQAAVSSYYQYMKLDTQSKIIDYDTIGYAGSSAIFNSNFLINDDGEGFALYNYGDSDAFMYQVDVSYYDNENRWSDFETISNYNKNSRYAGLVCNTQGDFLCSYIQVENGTTKLYMRQYHPGDGWGGLILIESGVSCCYPIVRYDHSGNIIAVWIVYNETADEVDYYMKKYENDNLMTAEKKKVNGKKNNSRNHCFSIDIDQNNNIIATWINNDSGGIYNVWVNRYDSESETWSEPRAITSYTDRYAVYPEVKFDVYNNAIVTWKVVKGPMDGIDGIVYQPGTGWGDIQVIRECKSEGLEYIEVVTRRDGSAVATWVEWVEGLQYIYSSAYR